jgi:hypothetical protein
MSVSDTHPSINKTGATSSLTISSFYGNFDLTLQLAVDKAVFVELTMSNNFVAPNTVRAAHVPGVCEDPHRRTPFLSPCLSVYHNQTLPAAKRLPVPILRQFCNPWVLRDTGQP